MNDTEHSPELTGCGPLHLSLDRVERRLQRGAESDGGLQDHEGGDGPEKGVLGGLLDLPRLEEEAGLGVFFHLVVQQLAVTPSCPQFMLETSDS